MDKGECRRPTGINFRTFIVFNIRKRLASQTVSSLIQNFLITSTITTSTINLINDLTKISEWAVQWEMSFNPDPSKQAQELLFAKSKFQTIPIIEF